MASLSACGDDDENLSPFCEDVRAADESFAEADDVAGLGEALRDMDAEPPEEIAEPWELVLENWDELAAEGDDVDLDNEDVDVDEVEALAERRQELGTAWRAVSSYLRDVCAMDLS